MKTYPLISRTRIKKRVKQLGQTISFDYQGKNLILLGVLKGSLFFLADLMRQISIDHRVEFIQLASYGYGKKSSGQVKLKSKPDSSLKGKDVLIVEDIVDSGCTLDYLYKFLKRQKVASIKSCSLLQKPARHKFDHKIDYCGFSVPNKFLVGYGLDYAGKMRNLADICYLK